MKTEKFQRRFYRDWVSHKDLKFSYVTYKETDLQILTNRPLDTKFVEECLRILRWDIESYITRDRRFLSALKPVEVELHAPAIVKEMSEAGKLAFVGPMAAVAGAIAEFLGRDLLKEGYKDVIVENGGDIFIQSRKSRIVRIYTGSPKLWKDLSIKISPKMMPLGICTSSGTVGHSLSFGAADSVVVLAKNAALADAVATATANRVQSKADLEPALKFARSIKGVKGVIIIIKNNLASAGEVKFIKS
ncbi:MAG: UPF0280 family protein [Candidatus Omnitrophota bacterium]